MAGTTRRVSGRAVKAPRPVEALKQRGLRGEMRLAPLAAFLVQPQPSPAVPCRKASPADTSLPPRSPARSCTPSRSAAPRSRSRSARVSDAGQHRRRGLLDLLQKAQHFLMSVPPIQFANHCTRRAMSQLRRRRRRTRRTGRHARWPRRWGRRTALFTVCGNRMV